MRKIVQLDEYDYNKLADLAKLNEKEIEKHAIDLWKEKGVAEITIKIDTGRDYNDYCRIDCSTYLFYKDNRFYIPENVRERFRKIVKENVMWDIEERFGDLKGAINKFNREAKWIGYTKFGHYKINCVTHYFFSKNSSVGERPAPRGGTTCPDERKITII